MDNLIKGMVKCIDISFRKLTNMSETPTPDLVIQATGQTEASQGLVVAEVTTKPVTHIEAIVVEDKSPRSAIPALPSISEWPTEVEQKYPSAVTAAATLGLTIERAIWELYVGLNMEKLVEIAARLRLEPKDIPGLIRQNPRGFYRRLEKQGITIKSLFRWDLSYSNLKGLAFNKEIQAVTKELLSDRNGFINSKVVVDISSGHGDQIEDLITTDTKTIIMTEASIGSLLMLASKAEELERRNQGLDVHVMYADLNDSGWGHVLDNTLNGSRIGLVHLRLLTPYLDDRAREGIFQKLGRLMDVNGAIVESGQHGKDFSTTKYLKMRNVKFLGLKLPNLIRDLPYLFLKLKFIYFIKAKRILDTISTMTANYRRDSDKMINPEITAVGLKLEEQRPVPSFIHEDGSFSMSVLLWRMDRSHTPFP